MAVQVTFYKYYGENNRIDKSSLLANPMETILGTAREPLDQVLPEIEFRMNLLLTDYNYAKIVFDENRPVESTRWYYVEECTMVNNNLTLVRFRSDPLYTFKDSILQINAVAIRAEKQTEQSPFIYDEKVVFSTRKTVQVFPIHTMGRGFNQNIILVVAG
jgi:hypothetical protein